MATKKVLYFTADKVPTTGELADLTKLNAAALPGYDIQVRNTDISTNIGHGVESADYVAGTVPADVYDGVTVLDPDNLPSGLPATQAIVSDGVDLVVPVTGTYATKITPTIAAGVITGFVLS
jgi:hypothetical protein